MTDKTLLALEEIYVSYQRAQGSPISVLDNLNIRIRENEIVAVVGASGVGSSGAGSAGVAASSKG